MRFLHALALAAVLAPAPAPAAEAQKPPGIAVLEFSAAAADKDKAKALAGVVATRLASYQARVIGLDEVVAALGLEKQKQSLGCSEEGCLQEISYTGQAVAGLAYVPFTHFGLGAETSINLSGVTASGGGVTFAFNTNFGVLFLF